MNYKVGNGSSQSFLNCHSQLWNNYTSLPAFSFPLLGLPEHSQKSQVPCSTLLSVPRFFHPPSKKTWWLQVLSWTVVYGEDIPWVGPSNQKHVHRVAGSISIRQQAAQGLSWRTDLTGIQFSGVVLNLSVINAHASGTPGVLDPCHLPQRMPWNRTLIKSYVRMKREHHSSEISLLAYYDANLKT